LPKFTDDELRVIHRDILSMGWQPKEGYELRRSFAKKLDDYFGTDTVHLKGILK
jgi:hypothetical protein